MHATEFPLIKRNIVLKLLFRIQNGKICWTRAVLLLYLPCILTFIACMIEGTIIRLPDECGLSFFSHIGLLSEFILFPIIVLTFVSVLSRFSSFMASFPNLYSDKMGEDRQKSKDNHLFSKLEGIIRTGYLDSKYTYISLSICIFFGLGLTVLNIYNTADTSVQLKVYTHDTFDSINYPLGFITTKFFFLFYWGILSPIMVQKFIIIIASLNYLFRLVRKTNSLNLNPLHPDNAGGIGELGNIAIRLNYTVGISVLFLVALYLSHGLYYTLVIGIVLVMVLLCAVFFLPLHEAHKAMKEVKRRLLENLSEKYLEVNKKLTQRFLTIKNPSEIFNKEGDDLYDTHQKLSDIYQHIQKLPTWPYDIPTLSRFLGTLMIPILMFIIDMLTNTDSILFHLGDIFK